MGIQQIAIATHLAAADLAPDTDARGKAFEKLIIYLFEEVPGCLVVSNIVGPLRTEQIDVAVGIRKRDDGFGLLPSAVLIECKDWEAPVGSAVVGYFLNILATRAVEVGILFAANGVTGTPDSLRHAHSLGIGAAARHLQVLVIERTDLAAIDSSDDFIELIERRFLASVASGTLGVGT